MGRTLDGNQDAPAGGGSAGRSPESNALVVGDQNQRSVGGLLTSALSREGIRSVPAASPADASRLIAERQFDAVVLNLQSGASEGLQFLSILQERAPQSMVIVVTGEGAPEGAVQTVRNHADHYVVKAFDLSELIGSVKRELERRHMTPDLDEAPDAPAGHQGFEGVAGRSPKMREIHRLASIVAPTDATVLIAGETGTGKELLARSIHAQSRRVNGPWVVMHCGAIPETLLETEVFGHEKGAFTNAVSAKPGRFERAEGGTIFLDEVGDMSLGMQMKLLRVLQERTLERVGGVRTITVNTRVIAATNRDLRRMVREGTFRADLYYRLAVVPLTLPSLRERPEDIPILAHHFLQKYRRQTGKAVRGFSRAAMEKICQHSWPGNVRELEYGIERAVLLCDGDVIVAEDFQFDEHPLEDR